MLLEKDPSLNSYRDLVLDAVSYPWRRGGAYILVPGTFLALAFAFGVWAPVIGLVSMGIGACFFSAFYLQIVESTIAGRHSLPDWPSFADFYDDMLKPGFQMAVVFVMSTLIYVAAAWGLSSVSISFTTEETQMAIWREVGQAVYSLYIPMAVMGLVLHGSAAGALPHRVIPAIMRCMPGYLGGVCIMALISLTTDWLRESARMIPDLPHGHAGAAHRHAGASFCEADHRGVNYAFFVFTARLRSGKQVVQMSQTVPSQPRAEQCSRP
jgi:hypothetical protein